MVVNGPRSPIDDIDKIEVPCTQLYRSSSASIDPFDIW